MEVHRRRTIRRRTRRPVRRGRLAHRLGVVAAAAALVVTGGPPAAATTPDNRCQFADGRYVPLCQAKPGHADGWWG